MALEELLLELEGLLLELEGLLLELEGLLLELEGLLLELDDEDTGDELLLDEGALELLDPLLVEDLLLLD